MNDEAEIIEFYESLYEEAERGSRVPVQIEFVRTQEIIRRFLTGHELRVADIGGGPGVHAQWLADDGHEVTLVDPVPRHVARASEIQSGAGSVTAQLGDARSLAFEDETFDAVLLLGPLYHLQEFDQRIRALDEARRVLRQGGTMFVAGISRFASLHDGLAMGRLFEAGFREMVERDLATGSHLNPEQRPGWFTTAYFHRPEELEREMRLASLVDVTVFGLEGLAGWLENLDIRWSDPTDRRTILETIRATEIEPTLLGLSAHLLGVGRRPE